MSHTADSTTTFDQRDFTGWRVWIVRDTTYVEIVSAIDSDGAVSTARFTQTGSEPWLDYEVKDGDPPYPADEITSGALDAMMTALNALALAWMEK